MRINPTYPMHEARPFAFEDPARDATAMQEVSETIIFADNYGQRFSGIYVNRDFSTSGNPLIVRANSMFGDSRGSDQKYIAHQEAAAFPEHPIVVIDQPAHGASDILTSKQAKAIKESADLGPVADAQIEAISNRIPEARRLIVTGEAVGARMAAELACAAPEYDLETLQLFGFDMPGLERRKSAAVGIGFLLREPKARALYQKGEDSQHLQQAFADFQGRLADFGDFTTPNARTESGVFMRERSLGTFLLRNSPLATDAGYDTLVEATELNKGMAVDLVFGGLSALGRLTEDVEARLVQLDAHSISAINWSVWPNDNQGMGLAPNRPRLTDYERDHIAA